MGRVKAKRRDARRAGLERPRFPERPARSQLHTDFPDNDLYLDWLSTADDELEQWQQIHRQMQDGPDLTTADLQLFANVYGATAPVEAVLLLDVLAVSDRLFLDFPDGHVERAPDHELLPLREGAHRMHAAGFAAFDADGFFVAAWTSEALERLARSDITAVPDARAYTGYSLQINGQLMPPVRQPSWDRQG